MAKRTVAVAVAATSKCHTDMSYARQTRPILHISRAETTPSPANWLALQTGTLTAATLVLWQFLFPLSPVSE